MKKGGSCEVWGVVKHLQPRSVSGVSFCFGMDVWCLFSMLCMILCSEPGLGTDLYVHLCFIVIRDLTLFLSFTQPKTSANISAGTEWQSGTAHSYACEEALAKLMVSSAKAGSCGWWKQVGVKVLVWRRDRGNQWKHNSTETETICFRCPSFQLYNECFVMKHVVVFK